MFPPELADFLQVLARPLVETKIGAHEGFGDVHAERFNLVVEVNVAPCIDCGCTREARRAAPYLERDGEHRDHHHDDARDRKRDPRPCVARSRRRVIGGSLFDPELARHDRRHNGLRRH